MISAINSVSSAQAVETTSAARAAAPSQVASKANSSPSATTVPADKVTLSSVAQSMRKELAETPAQTQQEANAGDLQAKRLLAEEAAARGR